MKFIYGYYDEQTGQSIVQIANKKGNYVGYAQLHPDDKEHASKYAGCRLAQQRAWLKYFRSELRTKKDMLKAIQILAKDIDHNCDFIAPDIKRRINIQIRNYNQQIETIKKSINQLENFIKKSQNIRDQIIKGQNKIND